MVEWKSVISAVILSHNDPSLARCLKSLEFCDELVIIDDESLALSVPKSRKVHVYKRALHGDFAAQRNWGLSKAKGEWVLFVDSDEVVSEALAKEIQKSVTIDCAGFFLKRQDWLFGKRLLHGETSKVRLLRLAKKSAGSWTRPVHEVWTIEGTVGTLTAPLDHFPHPNVAQFIDEINKYSTLNARFLYEQKISVRWWHILAYPGAKFFVDYVWYLGFLDGTPGAIVALMMSMHSFLTRGKLWLLWHKHE